MEIEPPVSILIEIGHEFTAALRKAVEGLRGAVFAGFHRSVDLRRRSGVCDLDLRVLRRRSGRKQQHAGEQRRAA